MSFSIKKYFSAITNNRQLNYIGIVLLATGLLTANSGTAQETTIAADSASNYSSFIGNQGFGFGAWTINTPGGGKYISNETPRNFGLWNSTANAAATAARPFNATLAAGQTFSVQLQMNTLDTAGNTNGFALQDAAGNTLFRYWHQGGDNADGHFADAVTSGGTATGFAYDYQQLDAFAFTLATPTNYSFTDLSTGAHFDGTIAGTGIAQAVFFRANGDATPSNGQDFKFNTLTITAPGQPVDESSLAYEGFEYPPGAVASQNGGFGWGGNWTNVAGNAMYFNQGNLLGEADAPAEFDAHSQGNYLCGYGGSRVGRLLDCSTNGFFAQQRYLNGNGVIGASGKTLYLSFLEQPAVTSKFYEFELHRGDYGDPGRIAGIGNDTSGTDTYFRMPNGTFSSLGAGDTAVNFYVVRIDFHGGNDDVRIYRNPTSLAEPVTPTLTRLGAGNLSFDRLCVGAWGNYVAIDEIRLGTAWTNVIGRATAATGSVQSVAITNASMIGLGMAQFVPEGFDVQATPSLSLVSEPVTTGMLSSNWTLIPQFTLVNSNACASLDVPESTSLYGGGEVAGPLLRNGQTIEIWNTDTAGWSTDNLRRMYQAHPWVLGVRPDGTAFGVLFDSTYKASLHTGNRRIVFETLGPIFRTFIIDRASPQAVLEGLAELTGTIPLPPEWALGYHQCRFSYYPASQVQSIASGFRTRQIPCDALWMDIGYMKYNRDFTIDSSGFPSMPALTGWLHTNGFHAVTILDPAIAVDPNYFVYQSGTANALWVQTAGGQPYQADSTPGNSVWPDFTLPTARTWWANLCQNFMTNGMDGLWIDMDEPSANNALTALNTMPYDNWHRGGNGLPAGSHLQYHNAYGLLESLATYQGELAAHPDRRPFVLTRANFIGGQRYAATWTGDNVSSTDDMLVSVPMSLTLGLSGQPFSGPDLGGFIADATPDLWGNWVGFGAFLPFCRGHSTIGTNQKEPWAFGATVENAARIALQRRYRLLPYLYTLFHNCSQTGIPVMQPVFFADPADLSLRAEQQAFLLGADLLVIPSWAKKPALPKGIWQPLSLVTGDQGTYQARLQIRGGAILPVGAVIQNTTQDSFAPLMLIVCLDTNGYATGTLYRDAGDGWGYQSGDYCLQTFTAQKSGDSVTVQLASQQGSHPVTTAPVHVEIVTSNAVYSASGNIGSGITVAVTDQPNSAQLAFEAYNAAFLIRTNGQTYYKRSLSDISYAGTWVQALEIQLAEDAYERTHSLNDLQLVADLTTTFLAKENYNWALDTWNDDIAWMTIACIRGYQITGNPALLTQATNAWNMAYNRGWDTALGGGIWEEMNAKDAKCALSTDPMIIAGAALYQATGQSAYLTKCENIYAWVRNNIFNPANGQVYEGIRSNGTAIVSDNVYNSGAFINAANALHHLTGATNYYADALLAARHVMTNNAILSNAGRGDSTWQDQFVRGLANFAQDN
ncbi:MAG TPA: TIM-barrel domain-containing protein, partial [Dongiaceae bacterium]|nr:TIM-barrel domain-containing protein [Dongiaceae bacterium]